MARIFILRFLLGLGLGVIIVALLFFNTLLIWVATGPRDLDQYTPYIEKALSPEDGSFHVRIGKAVLLWDGWRNPVSIRIRDVKMLTPHNKVFSDFPLIYVAVDIPSLMIGQIRPTTLTIDKPIISLLQRNDYSIGFGYNAAIKELPTQADISPMELILRMFSQNNRQLSHLRQLQITDGNISIGHAQRGIFFRADHTQITIERNNHDVLDLKASSQVTYGKKETPLVVSMTIDENGEYIEGGINFENVVPAEVESFFSNNDTLAQLTMPVSGSVQFSTHPREHQLNSLGFQITGGKAQIEDARLDGMLIIDRFEFRGEITDNLTKLRLQQCTADLDGVIVRAEGTATLIKPYEIYGTVQAEKANEKAARLLWPPGLSPISREWVLTNIMRAEVPLAQATLAIKAGDLDKLILPKEAIDAQIDIKSATLRYLPEHPPVTQMNATLFIDGISLKAAIQSANYLENSKLFNGTLEIPDLMADNPRIELAFEAHAPASDAVHVLELPRLEHAKRLGLERSMQGNVKAKTKLAFDFFAPHDEAGNPLEPDIFYDISADLAGITQKGVLGKFDMQDVSGQLHANAQTLTINGKGIINGVDVTQADVKYLFQPQEGLDTFINLEAVAPVGSISRFDFPEIPFLEGEINVKAEVKQGPENELARVELDLTPTEIKNNALGWTKKSGKKASFIFNTQKDTSGLSIPSFNFTGPNADVSGKALISNDHKTIKSLEITSSTVGENKINDLIIKEENTSTKVILDAGEMNLATYMDADNSDFSFEKFPAIHLDAKIKKLVLSNGYPIDSFKSRLTCSTSICSGADLSGKIHGQAFRFQIMKNSAGKRQLAANVPNAGNFLHAFSIFDGMKDGTMSISANYEKTVDNSTQLNGHFIILDFTLTDAPVLAKILSLASLTGFIDTMQGKGIAFKKLKVPFNLKHDVITIKDAKAYGPAMGITIDGTITMPGILLNLAGTVVPSYTLNNSVSKVPLIGPLLTGGGEGVFAASYSVKDSYKDPKVSVNPLSILAPGFLRNLFEGFEPKKDEKMQ